MDEFRIGWRGNSGILELVEVDCADELFVLIPEIYYNLYKASFASCGLLRSSPDRYKN